MTPPERATTSERTFYSTEIEGDERNHNLAARFDMTGGYVGIQQSRNGTTWDHDRVLLSPAQVKALQKFLRASHSGRTAP